MLSALQVRFGASPSLRIAAVDHHSDDRFVNAQITVRNLSPFAVTDARVVATTDAGVELSGVSVASLNRGETRIVSLDSIAQPTVDQRLFARVETSIADANPADNVFEIVFRDAPAPAFSFSLWPDGGAFVSGDPVRAGQGILIARPAGVSLGELQLTADGQAVVADSLFVDGSALYRPGATAGDHLLHAAVDFDGQLYQAQIRVVAADGLTLANSLVYPNPVRGAAGFTYVLSHKAEVTVELFSLNGRLIRRLEPQRLPAGFAETKWDGRGDDGRQLANGTYLYRIRARDDDGVVVEHRAPFVVTR
jgi:hypothetical protein